MGEFQRGAGDIRQGVVGQREVGIRGDRLRGPGGRPAVDGHCTGGDQRPGPRAARGEAGGDQGRVEAQVHSAARLMKPPDCANAKRREPALQAALLERRHQRTHDARPGGADWMPERDRTAVHVDAI
jgi:hypothetical protein